MRTEAGIGYRNLNKMKIISKHGLYVLYITLDLWLLGTPINSNRILYSIPKLEISTIHGKQ